MDGVHGDDAERVLASLVRLVTDWSSVSVQGEIAARAGVEVDAGDVQLLYTIGAVGPIRPAGLADRVRQSRPTVTKQLARLESRGWLRRDRHASDGRGVVVDLSAEGRDAYDRLVAAGRELVTAALMHWSRGDVAAWSRSFERFVDELVDPRAD